MSFDYANKSAMKTELSTQWQERRAFTKARQNEIQNVLQWIVSGRTPPLFELFYLAHQYFGNDCLTGPGATKIEETYKTQVLRHRFKQAERLEMLLWIEKALPSFPALHLIDTPTQDRHEQIIKHLDETHSLLVRATADIDPAEAKSLSKRFERAKSKPLRLKLTRTEQTARTQKEAIEINEQQNQIDLITLAYAWLQDKAEEKILPFKRPDPTAARTQPQKPTHLQTAARRMLGMTP